MHKRELGAGGGFVVEEVAPASAPGPGLHKLPPTSATAFVFYRFKKKNNDNLVLGIPLSSLRTENRNNGRSRAERLVKKNCCLLLGAGRDTNWRAASAQIRREIIRRLAASITLFFFNTSREKTKVADKEKYYH